MTDLAERQELPRANGDADRRGPEPQPPPLLRRFWSGFRLVLPALLVVLASLVVLEVSAEPPPAGVTAGAPPTTASPAPSGGAAPGATPTAAHAHEAAVAKPLSATDQKAFSQQMATAREIAARYPTVADVTKAGYKRAGPFAPGAGAHFVAPDAESAKAVAGFDLAHPLDYLYSGTDPTSVLLGIMYYTLTPTAPEGFVGPNDVFHKHEGICLTKGGDGGFDTPFPVDADTTKAQCDGVNGEWMATTGWMLHVWTAPGWESPIGVFSHDNPLVVCADGTASIDNDKLNQGCRGT